MSSPSRSRPSAAFPAAVLAIGLSCLLVPPAPAAVIHVDDDAPPGGDGSGWASAHRFLQDALAGAAPGDEIRVAGGRHRPDQDALNPAGSLDSGRRFVLASGMRLVGGFAGLADPADPDRRDPDAFPTELTGDLLGNDGPDFTRRTDNSTVLLRVTSGEAPVTIGDCSLRAASGSAIDIGGGEVLVRRCRLLDCDGPAGSAIRAGCVQTVTVEDSVIADHLGNGAEGCAIALESCGELRLVRSIVRDVVAEDAVGAAIRIDDGGDLRMIDSTVRDVRATVGAIGAVLDGTIELDGCTFVANEGGALFGIASSLIATDLLVRGNHADLAGGGFLAQADLMRYANCRFIENTGFEGGLTLVSNDVRLVNCVFADNEAGPTADALDLQNGSALIIHCTFDGHAGRAIQPADPSEGTVIVRNSIITGPGEPFGGSPSQVFVERSLVEGGWPGDVIDGDPMYVQPGTYDFRLANGSPCIDTGSVGFVPLDDLDLDGDGDTGELLPIDVAGEDRFQGGSVDMGAYEGAFLLLPPGDDEIDLDEGEIAILVPGGPIFDPLGGTAAFVLNLAGGPDGEASAVDVGAAEPGRPRLEDAPQLELTSSIADGLHLSTVFVPFTTADLAGAEPLETRLSGLDPASDRWPLAVARNVASSPGHDGPIGDRLVTVAPEPWALTQEVGDHGVHWDPALGRGFAWAHVDRGGTFGLRFGACPGDTSPRGGDNVIDVDDLLAVLGTYGTDDPWTDVDGSGIVDGLDLAAVLEGWGGCP